MQAESLEVFLHSGVSPLVALEGLVVRGANISGLLGDSQVCLRVPCMLVAMCVVVRGYGSYC